MLTKITSRPAGPRPAHDATAPAPPDSTTPAPAPAAAAANGGKATAELTAPTARGATTDPAADPAIDLTTKARRRERPAPLDRGARTVVALVVLGAITTVLDATIVSVALDRLAGDFAVGLTTVQWVMTGYLLALAAVIPVTGWAVDRFGAKPVWLVAVGTFTAGSLACGLAWSAPSLIAFRVLQGVGGGMVFPVGMTMVARAVGHERMGRAMAVVGIPMMLGPILGPVVGGVLVSAADWRWIFFLNLPIGVACLLWSARALEPQPGSRAQRLDAVGLGLLSPGLVALVYGVTSIAGDTDGIGAAALAWIGAGVALLVAFAVRAPRVAAPLLDLRHFTARGFTLAALVQVVSVGALTGAMFLLPLYYLQVRGASALETGLLLAPQGVGAAVSQALTGRLVDRGRGRLVVLAGTTLLTLGFVGYALAGSAGNDLVLLPAQVILGLGAGCLFAPTSAAAYATLDRAAIARATTLLSILQRTGGVVATAVFAVVLQHQLSGTADRAHAFSVTFWWPAVLAAVALVPALGLKAPAARPKGARK
ncbi:MDR family MFS transporter [Pseudofrankia sp. BMG5.36]|uniref:MDR family MFS transporter n=1 Tax=Pseudofrankia sp. BMG5.36 TaxID=1834512 RepID=UPI0009F64D96|nr:MDR family MFS transporter [Pseudofrankia sp. BMG5.36]